MATKYIIINELGDQVGPVMYYYEAEAYREQLEQHFTDFFSIVPMRGSEKPSKPRSNKL